MSFRRAVPFLLCAALVPALSSAATSPRRLNDPAGDMWGTGSRIPISQALVNPLVQVAMRDFDAQGYTRVPTYDCSRSKGDTTVVFLAYQQPGVPMSQSMPVIVVMNLPGSFGPVVNVMGGVLERGPDGSVRGATGANAHTVRVTSSGGLSTPATPSPFTPYGDPFYYWVMCTMQYCTECEQQAMPVLIQLVCCFVVSELCYKILVQ
jgi:hypothetical protein